MYKDMRECSECHSRLQNHSFTNDTDGRLCNACHNKRTKREQSGRGISSSSSSVNHTFVTEELPIPSSVPDPFAFIPSIKSTIADSLRNTLKIHGQIKWYPSSTMFFVKSMDEGVAKFPGHFAATPKILLQEFEIDDQIEESVQAMLERAGEFMDNGSDYVVDNLEKLEIYTCTYNPVGGSSYIALPQFLADKKCIINVRNDDDRCFEYSILAQLYPVKNNKNIINSYRKNWGKLNFVNIDVPVKISDIPRFERQNPTISIGVQTIDESNRIVPLYATKHQGRPHHVNLFYLTEFIRVDGTVVSQREPAEEGCVARHHYCLVSDLGRLLSYASAHANKSFPCLYCLHRYYSQFALDRHLPLCTAHAPCRIIFPSNKIKVIKGRKIAANDDDDDDADFGPHQTMDELLEVDADVKKELELIAAIAEGRCPENILCYKQQQYEFVVPFCVYADFESFIDSNDVHRVSGFCTLLTSTYLDNELPYCYSGTDPLKRFFEHLMSIRDRVAIALWRNFPMEQLTDEQEDHHEKSTHCYTCNLPFTPTNRKVRHHCHMTSAYIAPTCNSCNLKLKYRKFSKSQLKDVEKAAGKEFFIPIFFHNLRGYDSHLIIKALDKYNASGIKIIASTTEKFMSFSLGGFRFFYSFPFFNQSLCSFVKVFCKKGRGLV